MGEFKDMTDLILEKLYERLEEEGYDNISNEQHNEIVDLIGVHQINDDAFEELVVDAINIVNK